jgi:Bacterial PH domain
MVPSQGQETFEASRWTRGNHLFPTQIAVSPERVIRIKRRWFGSDEESIALSKVASVRISKGMFWADICIESTGGTDPIQSHGHRKADAERIRELIEGLQSRTQGAAR